MNITRNYLIKSTTINILLYTILYIKNKLNDILK